MKRIIWLLCVQCMVTRFLVTSEPLKFTGHQNYRCAGTLLRSSAARDTVCALLCSTDITCGGFDVGVDCQLYETGLKMRNEEIHTCYSKGNASLAIPSSLTSKQPNLLNQKETSSTSEISETILSTSSILSNLSTTENIIGTTIIVEVEDRTTIAPAPSPNRIVAPVIDDKLVCGENSLMTGVIFDSTQLVIKNALCLEEGHGLFRTVEQTQMQVTPAKCRKYSGMNQISSSNYQFGCISLDGNHKLCNKKEVIVNIESNSVKPQVDGVDTSAWQSWALCPTDRTYIASEIVVEHFGNSKLICEPLCSRSVVDFQVGENFATTTTDYVVVGVNFDNDPPSTIKKVAFSSFERTIVQKENFELPSSLACSSNKVVIGIRSFGPNNLETVCNELSSHIVASSCSTVNFPSSVGFPESFGNFITPHWDHHLSCLHLGSDYAIVELVIVTENSFFLIEKVDSITCCKLIPN